MLAYICTVIHVVRHYEYMYAQMYVGGRREAAPRGARGVKAQGFYRLGRGEPGTRAWQERGGVGKV